ncbi:hypothetical protein A3B45_00180 [Candidatus Daviesbacteria bacterium RIFCSPLOWO2_01_FULL_39_12]|uniref:Uncharacterized protein n=1 Tax=Candidatus Daviesbacteria bacterium RIFCSPLOWO2_01_FULL_39_12 TaxID=1797785 RepID=A0A1F5KPS7_9BACT|nr:MAG: hypothetical protein A3B45_00180 [Candidatus Daviesbacteria bacterium RIFCSPLOWO2_01_FULL_39_12]
MTFLKKYRVLLIVLILISLSLFLRFYRLSEVYIFGFDEEYQATYAWSIVKDPHPIWIGVSASFLDFYMGPYFTYFTALWLWISSGDPLLTAYVAALVGVITCLAVFFVGWKFFNLIVGIIASLLYAGLPLFVFYDQKYWNPMFVQLIVLVMFTSLMMIKKSPWWWLLYTAAVGAIFETDLTPLPLIIVGIWLFIKGRYFLNKKLVLSCILVFLLFYWPLLVFDYNHNWSNLIVLGRYSQQAEQAGAKFDPVGKMNSIVDTMGRFWYLAPGRPNASELGIFCNRERTYPAFWLSGLSIILLVYFSVKSFRNKKSSYNLLGYFLLVSLGFYIIYSGGSFEYYLHGFITLFTFVPAILISEVSYKLKPLLILLIFFILLIGLNTILSSSDKYSLGQKRKLIEAVMDVSGNNSFSINKIGDCFIYEGWRYLFKAYGNTPSKSFTDQNFAWLYPDEVISNNVDYNVVLTEDKFSKDEALVDYLEIKRGGFAAYIKKVK